MSLAPETPDARSIVFIDNHDSFSWNLIALLRGFGRRLVILHPEDDRVASLADAPPAAIVLSPGPGRPEHRPVVLDLLRRLDRTPILGICLGMQSLGVAYGASLRRLSHPRHGHPASITHHGVSIFKGLPSPLVATRYHSLGFHERDLRDAEGLEILGMTNDGGDEIVMALRHRHRPIVGVQFHPESFLSFGGDRLIANFLEGVP